jgi:hypothetical protein
LKDSSLPPFLPRFPTFYTPYFGHLNRGDKGLSEISRKNPEKLKLFPYLVLKFPEKFSKV